MKKRLIQGLFCFFIVLLCLKQYTAIVKGVYINTKDLVHVQGNFEELRLKYPIFAVTEKAKKVIPLNSGVRMNIALESLEGIAARYNLLPLEIKEDWDYFIDFQANKKKSFLVGAEYPILKNIKIYAKPSYSFIEKGVKEKESTSTKKIIQFIIISLFTSIIGYLILNLLHLNYKYPLSWTISTSFLIGYITLTALVWIFLHLGFYLETKSVIFLWSLCFCLLFFVSIIKHKEKSLLADKLKNKYSNRFLRPIFIFAISVIIIVSLLIAVTPIQDWDTMSNWIIKSKVMYHNKGLDISYTNQNHNYYPILWPLNIAIQFCLVDSAYDQIAKWTSMIFFLCFLSQFVQALYFLEIKPEKVWLSIVVYLGLFFCENPINTAMPENAFLALLMGLIFAILNWLASPQKVQFWILCLIMAVGLNLIKLEGFVTIVFCVFSLGCVFWLEKENFKKFAILITLLITTLFPIAWVQWTKNHNLFVKITHFQGDFTLTKLGIILQTHIEYFFMKGEWLLVFLAIVYFVYFPCTKKWSKLEVFLCVLAGLLLLFKWGAVFAWPITLLRAKGVYPDTAWRLLLHVSPVLILIWSSRAFGQKQKGRDLNNVD